MLRIGTNKFTLMAKRQLMTANLNVIDSKALQFRPIYDGVTDRLQEAFRSLMTDLQLLSQMPFIETLELLPSRRDSRTEE